MIATSSAESLRTRLFVRRSSFAWPVSSMKVLIAGRCRCYAAVSCPDGRKELCAAEHPLQLLGPLVVGELLDPRMRRIPRHLLDPEVPVGHARDLRQVRDRQDL